MFDPILVGVLATAAILALVLFIAARRRAPQIAAPEDEPGRPFPYGWTPPSSQYSFASVRSEQHTTPVGGIDEQPTAWRAALAELGARFHRSGVRRIELVHGTFVGDDPLAMGQQWEPLMARLDPAIWGLVRGLTKQNLDRIIRDAGNFHPGYAKLVTDALGQPIPCHLFVWSSSNHHVARLRAARDLIIQLGTSLGARPSAGRVLLIGHSHGGQIFALMTHLLLRSRIGQRLLEILASERPSDEERAQFDSALRTLRGWRQDFVTLGAPPRYGYRLHPDRCRVLHIVNHRGPEPRGASPVGALHTAGGDYVQQWGVAGSDLVTPAAADQAINRMLDEHLGPGADPTKWLHNVRTRPRVHRDGHTVLVDYGDASPLKPNFHQTGFGHAIYTKQVMLRFNLELIAEYLYPPRRTLG